MINMPALKTAMTVNIDEELFLILNMHNQEMSKIVDEVTQDDRTYCPFCEDEGVSAIVLWDVSIGQIDDPPHRLTCYCCGRTGLLPEGIRAMSPVEDDILRKTLQ